MISPIETYNGIMFKRDDLFMPYTDIPLSGGKVRQCISLLESMKDEIREKYNNTVATHSSVHSPQGIIVSSVAHHLGMMSILGVGGKVQFDKHPMLMYCKKHYNTELKILSGIAYTDTLDKKLLEYKSERNFYTVRFGINLEKNPEAIIDSISNQCENIPDKLDKIVIPTGSGITASGILSGLYKFRKMPKEVHIVQISGNDRTQNIKKILMSLYGYKSNAIKFIYHADKTYSYSKFVDVSISNGFELDPVYEAKAYLYAIKNNLLNSDSLFWVVGNSKPVREFVEKVS